MPEAQSSGERLASLKVAVSGHRGFIGRHLTAALCAAGAQVLPLAGDLRFPGTWTGDFDVLIHLAAAMPGGFVRDPTAGLANNLEATTRALEACRARKAAVVFASTCGVYGPSVVSASVETSLVEPATAYAQSKLIEEMLCRFYAAHCAVPTTILRLFNVFGEGQKRDFLVPYLVGCALERREAVVHHPESARDFVYIADVVRALVCAVSRREGLGIYNVGQGKAHTIGQVIERIDRIVGRPLVWQAGKGRVDLQPCVYAELQATRSGLGWAPEVSLEHGLRRIVEAWDCG